MFNNRDISILSNLRENSRQSLIDISRKTNIPVSTVYDRIKHHEKEIIKKHTSILDFPKLGYNIRAHIIISVDKKKEFQEFLLKHKNVNSVFKLNDEHDFSIDCIFKYMQDMQRFIESLDQFDIKSKQIHFISNEIKREEFLNSGAQ